MRDRSLQVKLYYTSLMGTIFVLSLLLGSIAYIAFKSAVKENEELVASIVAANAKEVEGQLGNGWTVAESVASSAIAMREIHMTRSAANTVTRQLFMSNPQLLGLGHYWEPNAFDGKDAEYVDSPAHDITGRYLVYWNRANGAVRAESLTGYQPESGENQYYYRPLKTRQPWASEPFAYKTTTGQRLMMMSLMVPLIAGGNVMGVAGVDIPLDAISQKLSKVKIFSGYGALISTDGLYASHPDDSRWGKPADLPSDARDAIKAGKAFSFQRAGWDYALEPVRIGTAPNPWALLVAYPHAESIVPIKDFVRTCILIGVVGLLLLAFALWFLIRLHISPLTGLTTGIQNWQGELDVRFERSSEDETGKLADAFNQFIQRLGGLVGSIRGSTMAVTQVSDHLGDTTRAVAERATAQHTATEEMANGITALAHSVTEVSQQAEDVEQLARNTEILTTQISADMTETLSGITVIDHTMDRVAGAVGDLERRSQQIAGIIAVIRSIADQTNLLALNAAIEAARAGEQGRGFAVVADEVRQLAERTSRSTGEIGEMIGAIGTDVRNTVNHVHQVGEAVSRGVEQLSASADGVTQIRAHAQDILRRISEVARQTQSQATTGEELSVAIQGVSRISEHNDKAIRILVEQSVRLRDQAGVLNRQLSDFKA